MTSPSEARSSDEEALRALYRRMIDGWNQRHGEAFAASFQEEGALIGFDGSELHGRADIASSLGKIFADHPTPPYVTKVRGVRLLTPETALLRAVAGMVPPGKTELEPKLHAHHTLVAVKQGGTWRIAHFQNTPAQFHGRPDLVQQLTEELRPLLG